MHPLITKINVMKRYFTIISMFLIGAFSLFGENISVESQTDIIIVKTDTIYKPGTFNRDRSANPYSIEVYLYPAIGEVEVSLYNIGAAEIGLYDSNGQEVCYDCVNTDIPVTVNLSTMASHGTFYIVINSELYYAEGMMTF